ncbi:DUF899 domain-containing protein [Verrucomicrobium spinosum]|uniref:DUF899 domain-containing protein n=1 Tax=Verrucomicrobium spinosum TaxID=2736 RepID=UPI00017446FC|nr:thioredoxin family protein [Verrucomicrobium spinosum]
MSTNTIESPSPQPQTAVESPLSSHEIVSRAEWIEARKALIKKEKAAAQVQDELAEERRKLPWVKVEKNYVFDTPTGKKSLADLFAGNSQLIVYHFMFGPGWKEGCPGCSFMVDHFDGPHIHLFHHDVTLIAVSRATLPELEEYKTRMGWKFPWVSAHDTDFNQDYHVSATEGDKARGKMEYNFEETDLEIDELPGVSVFYKDDHGNVFHTYSDYARTTESLLGAYHFLDITPKGSNENGPNFNLGDWVKRRDEYSAPTSGTPACCSNPPTDR